MNAAVQQKCNKLVSLLKQLFQLDQPDLDFGLYRIMHAKSAEISQYLEQDLPEQIDEILAANVSSNREEIEKEIESASKQSVALGINPEDAPKVKELRQKLSGEADTSKMAGNVFDALYNFFNRYYSEGDFLSKRVYKEGVYAVPYEGEEVKLHWANADQYYIKTSEYLRDYAFCLNPQSQENPRRVHFRIKDAAQGEHNNVKAAAEDKRFFMLASGDFAEEKDGELTLWFEYRPAVVSDSDEGKKKPTQKDLIESALKKVNNPAHPLYNAWFRDLMKEIPSASKDKGQSKTILEKQLNNYTARNSFDYFIHKDLGGFLSRELDFYIKNEMMRLDDIENQDAPQVEAYLAEVKAMRRIAKKLIEFLAQIEEFQKKLWLKKKFIVETNYCITLDRIPEKFYPEIAANDEQRKEWERLYSIDKEGISQNLIAQPYTVPLTVDYLKENHYLVLDTKFYSPEFKEQLIASIDDIDDQCNGLLVHSENFQALNLLQRRYQEQIKCIYIDPPYNAKSSEIMYKNEYKHSSWLSLIYDRINISLPMLNNRPVYICAIDEVEQEKLGFILSDIFDDNVFGKTAVSIVHNPSGQQGDNFTYTHEFAYFVYNIPGRSISEVYREDPKEWDQRNLRDVTGGESLRSSAKTCFYPILIKNEKVIGFGDVCKDDYHPAINEVKDNGIIEVYPIDPNGIERKWRLGRETVQKYKEELLVKYISSRNIYDIQRLKKIFNYKTCWQAAKYSANNYGTQFLNQMFGYDVFSYPKSIFTVLDCISAGLNENNNSIILDYFAGSGTTAHAVINLNREDRGSRKYILVEMGNHFDTVLKPRIEKVVYSNDWKEGEPVNRDSGISHCFKYIRLESYEDTLNNLKLTNPNSQTDSLFESKGSNSPYEDYLLHYFLKIETQDSPSLLDISQFMEPNQYKLNIKVPGSDEIHEQNVDLVETFNYLIGLVVDNISVTSRYTAEFDCNSEGRVVVKEKSLKQQDKGPYWFKTVEGHFLNGKRVLIIWRNRPGKEDTVRMVQDNAVLDRWVSDRGFVSTDSEYDVIYVNGTNNLSNQQESPLYSKVRLIEEEFFNKMWE